MKRITFRNVGPSRNSNLEINRGGIRVGRIAKRAAGGFYWYTLSTDIRVNTGAREQTLDECKAQARELLKA